MTENTKRQETYMTIGELAKKMGTTVRTLQYYDREGVLSAQAKSEGGRRLYTHKAMIQLHQIQSLKSLGFSLKDIKERLIPLDTPQEVAAVLSEQALLVQQKIEQLSSSLSALQALRKEVLQMQSVDFKKYADVIVNLQMDNAYYWLIKHFDDSLLDHIRDRFDRHSGIDFITRFQQLCDRAMQFKQTGVSYADERTQALAKEYWEMIMEFTGGDLTLLPQLMAFGDRIAQSGEAHAEWGKRQKEINDYLQPALGFYFEKAGIMGEEGDGK